MNRSTGQKGRRSSERHLWRRPMGLRMKVLSAALAIFLTLMLIFGLVLPFIGPSGT